MPVTTGTTLFLSFSGHDRDLAREISQKLAERLTPEGVHLFFDESGIEWGGRWVEVLQENLAGCAGYIILLGEEGTRGWVSSELGYMLQRHHQSGLPIFPLLAPETDVAKLPPFLSQFQAQRIDAATDYAQLSETLLRNLMQEASEAVTFNPDAPCPFPGLKAYEADLSRHYFGREREVLEALQHLGRGPHHTRYLRWLLVEGPSGVGKSSLVRAGLLPAIERGLLNSDGAFGQWRIAPPMRPGRQPLNALARVLREALGISSSLDIQQQLESDHPDALAALLSDHLPKGTGLILVIDQFEELFTLTKDDQAMRAFDRQLARALDDTAGPLHLITTIRSDFMLEFAQLQALAPRLNHQTGRYFLEPIGRTGLESIVRTPARLTGLGWSDPQLPGEIIDQAAETGAGALPLLGNLLKTLYEERHGPTLLRDTFRRLGGLGGALASQADGLIQRLNKMEQAAAKQLFLALVNDGGGGRDTRRTLTLSQALNTLGGPEHRLLLERLAGAADPDNPEGELRPRLITITPAAHEPDSPELTQVELAHEALLAMNPQGEPYWPTLHDWLKENRLSLERRSLLEFMAREWQRSGRPRSHLLGARQLMEFRGLPGVDAPAPAYLKASQRWLWGWRVVLASLLAAFGLSAAYIDGLMQSEYYKQEPNWKTLWYMLDAKAGWGLGTPLPKLASIPAGSFNMGSPDTDELARDSEKPRHRVTIGYAFEMGKYEVTFEEYDYYAYRTASRYPADEWGRGRQPVINVSWDDAQGYVQWLSEETGVTCRLPSEAEWEYAARARSQGRYHFGDDPARLGEFAWYRENAEGRAHAVGGKLHNEFGLHDMHGNLWEWVQDVHHESYQGAPSDGSAWEEGDGSTYRVLRGGSWSDIAEDARAADRGRSNPDFRYFNFGFRVLCVSPIHSDH